MTNPDAAKQMLAFAERIFRRADGLDDVVPADHQPNWKDRPSRFRIYPGTPQIPLLSPSHLYRKYARHVAAPQGIVECVPSLWQLAEVLYLMAGPLRRKLDLTWNDDSTKIEFTKQEYARGTASGGGLYPVQLYVAAAKQQTLRAGVYHYSTAQHALVPVRYGDWTPKLAAAISPGSNSTIHPYYLILSVDFWSNCFKYHNFGYHVCCEDVGAMLATLHLAAGALSIRHMSFLAFDDFSANEVIGADGRSESVFAVEGLGPGAISPDLFNGADSVDANEAPAVAKPWQRSRRINIPEELIDVHRQTLMRADEVPVYPVATNSSVDQHQPGGLRELSPAGEKSLEATIRQALPSVLLARRSAWGSMHGESPLRAGDLEELLRFVSRRSATMATFVRERIPAGGLQLALRINTVEGYARGTYYWSAETESLVPLPSKQLDVWQSTYSMTNYNVDEAACILFVVGNLNKVMGIYGPRGYRILNACVGGVAQLTYVAAAALHLDCGAVLGVRAQHVKRTLMLEAEQNVFLAIYLSKGQKRAEFFNFRLIPDVPTWTPAH